MPQKQHVMHGRDHTPNGADPIPGVAMAAPAGSLEGAYLNAGGLEAWWRLGESGTWPTTAMETPNFASDSSGNGHHMKAMNVNNSGGTAVVWITSNTMPGYEGVLPNLDIPGALISGDPDINDGAIRFNYNQYQWITFSYKLCLEAPAFTLQEGNWASSTAVGGGMTISCWIKFFPTTWPGIITGVDPMTPAESYPRPLFGDHHRSFGIGSWGTLVRIQPYYGYLNYRAMSTSTVWEYTTSYGLVPDQWYFFAMVLKRTTASGVTPALYSRRLLLNMNEIAAVTGDATAVALASGSHSNLTIGGAWDDDIRFAHSAGAVDEFAVFSRPLTDVELYQQYTVKVQNEGDTWDVTNVGAGPSGTDNTVTAPGVPDGIALVGDGAGGTEWGYPKRRVYVGGA